MRRKVKKHALNVEVKRKTAHMMEIEERDPVNRCREEDTVLRQFRGDERKRGKENKRVERGERKVTVTIRTTGHF